MWKPKDAVRHRSMMITMLASATMLAIAPTRLSAQCSDAGVCSVGSPHGAAGHAIGVSYSFGTSGKADDLTFHALELEGDLRIFDDARLSVRLPWSRISGPLGSASGVGDLTLLWDQSLWNENNDRVAVQVGGKFATGNANAAALPQAYQPGLGTNDLLSGVSYESEPWLFAIGYQLSRGRSNNAVTRLKRGDDLLLRIGYEFQFDDLLLRGEFLSIKRLHNSSVLSAAGNAFGDVPRSDQFQINAVATLRIPLSDLLTLHNLVAVPLLDREINVDGLTRSFSLSAALQASL